MAPADASGSCAGVRWDSMHSVAAARSVTTWLPCKPKEVHGSNYLSSRGQMSREGRVQLNA
jgi:hypothetical protein